MKNILKLSLVPLSLGFLIGCLSSDLEHINKSNRNWTGFPTQNHSACAGKLKTWEDLPVPVFGHVTKDVELAISMINKKTDSPVLKISQGSSDPREGIKISYGTAVKPKNVELNDFTPVAVSGTTSGEVGGWGYPKGYPLNRNCKIKGLIVVNLDEKERLIQEYNENVSLLIAHELLHALGLYAHIEKMFDSSHKVPVTSEGLDVLGRLYRSER